jgi:membrane-associated phospholipid phosphatase
MESARPHEHDRHRIRWIVGQAGLVALGVFIYFMVRGLTVGSTDVALAHSRDLLLVEQAIGLDVEATWQRPVVVSDTVETLANWVYIWGHWPVIIVTMVWLAWRHRDVFRRLRDAMMVSGLLGMLVFVTYPVAPPRLAGLGLVDTVTETSSAYRVLQPPAFVNQYAAMPSLHSGWDLLVGIAIVSAATSVALRLVGVLLPVLMAYSVVATANHYVIDVAAGLTLALIGYAVAIEFEHRRDVRSSRRAAGATRASLRGDPRDTVDGPPPTHAGDAVRQ